MSRSHVSAEGDLPPAAFVAALTDFGPSRSAIWGSSSPGLFQVHDSGEGWADVTEGTSGAGIWQRYRYDWSVPGHVSLVVTDSNAFGPGSSWEYVLTALDHGTRCRVDLTIVRVPTTRGGRLVDPLLSLFGGLYFGRDLRRSLRRLEQVRSTAGEDAAGGTAGDA